MKFEYLNDEHRIKFQDLRRGLAEEYRFSKKHLSICFLLAGNIQLHNKMGPYFDGIVGNLNSDLMFQEQNFCSERTLVRLALNLFNGNEQISPLELVDFLNTESFKLSLNAILIRRHGISQHYPINDEY